MHRVLSFQMNHQDEDQPTETISKRLCCSVLFTTAFLSIVGGYLLGRYATERAILIKQLNIPVDDHHHSDLIKMFINATHVLESNPISQSQISSILHCQTDYLQDLNQFKGKEISNVLTGMTGCLKNITAPIRPEIAGQDIEDQDTMVLGPS